MATAEGRRVGAPAVARALQVLELLAEAGSMSLTEVATRLDMAKSSAHHILAALADADWIERDPETMRATLGLRAWEVGVAYDTAQTLTQRAMPFMDAVRDETGETVRLAVRSGTDHICLAKSPGTHRLVFDQRVGARLPCHCSGLGKALLTGLSNDELADLYGGPDLEIYTETTIPDLASLQAAITQARERGWVEDNGEYILGIRCVAVPVLNRVGGVVAALSVSGTTAQFSTEQARRCRDLLIEAADELSTRLGEQTLSA